MTIVGTGAYRYELVENWARLPAGQTFGNTSAVATDARDRVYVFQRKDPPVQVFERDGTYVHGWGIGAFANPHGIYIAGEVAYLTDRDDSVCLTYTLDGKPLQVLGKRGEHSDTGGERPGELVPRAAGPFNYPTEMVPAPSGELYVTDGYRTPACTGSPPRASSSRRGASRARRSPTTSTFRTVSSRTGMGASTSATGRTTASRSSPRTATSWTCGPTCGARWTSRSTATGSSASARAASPGWRRGSA
jgi:hypothetical protein